MQVWYIRMFGVFRAERNGEEIFRFSTRKTGALLAYLALRSGQWHSREILCELLWPDDPPEASRARLRVALTSLRRQLEPPGVPAGSVLRSDGHEHLQIAAETVATDVDEVERALRILDSESPLDARIAAAQQIVTRFPQPLLTDFYDDWVVTERERLSQTAVERLCALAKQLPPDEGLPFARHAAHLDPLAEEPLFVLLPLLARSGERRDAALRAYESFCRRWKAATGLAPSEELQELIASLPRTSRRATEGDSGGEKKASRKTASAPVPEKETPAVRRLPAYLTRFFGREAEQKELGALLGAARLVSITGPGGAGKTRLAVETARAGKDGSCWFVPLAEVDDAERLPAALCDSLKDILPGGGARGGPNADRPEALLARAATALNQASRPLLLLDNLEQIADAAGSSLLTLLERVPDLRLAVTSRLRLNLPGERELAVGPLPLPEEQSDSADLAEVAPIPSVALFIDRARAARPDFQITPRNRDDILAICRMLEGMPLAIELVAARSASLVPSQMRAHLTETGNNLRIEDRRSGSGDRHRSLYAAIEWSYRLLPPSLGHLFSTLSVFRGGFTVGGVAAVAETSEEEAREGLARLRAHSLAEGVADAAEMRYTLRESLRTFAAEKLEQEEGSQKGAARQRHAAWYAELAERADEGISGPEQPAWLERLDSERDNLRAAIRTSLEDDPPRALQIAGAIWMYWHLRGHPTEGRAWLERALAACPMPSEDNREARARALHGAGTLAWVQNEGATAQPLFEEALRLRRAVGDSVGVAGTLNNLGLLAWSRQELDEARRFLGESLAIRREQGASDAAIASSLHNLGVLDWERGDYVSSRASCEEALALCRRAGDRVGEGHALNNLGNNALGLGHLEEAEDWYAQSLALKRILGYPPGIAATLSNLGITEMRRDRLTEAAAHCEEALKLYREMDAPEGVIVQLRNLGQIAVGQGDGERARDLLAQSLRMRRESDSPRDIAGNLEAFVLLASAQKDAERVARLMGAATTLRDGAHMPLHPSERVPLDRAVDDALQALGTELFAQKLREGAALSVEEMTALALETPPATVAGSSAKQTRPRIGR